MTTKICSKCNTERPIEEFARNSSAKDGYRSDCKKCSRAVTREHYLNNKHKYEKARILRRAQSKAYVIDYLLNNPCSLCGESDIRVLDFDHLPKFDKLLCVSTLISDGNIEDVKREIQKCRVLCSNCHRKYTAEVQDTYKYKAWLKHQQK